MLNRSLHSKVLDYKQTFFRSVVTLRLRKQTVQMCLYHFAEKVNKLTLKLLFSSFSNLRRGLKRTVTDSRCQTVSVVKSMSQLVSFNVFAYIDSQKGCKETCSQTNPMLTFPRGEPERRLFTAPHAKSRNEPVNNLVVDMLQVTQWKQAQKAEFTLCLMEGIDVPEVKRETQDAENSPMCMNEELSEVHLPALELGEALKTHAVQFEEFSLLPTSRTLEHSVTPSQLQLNKLQ